MARLGAWRVTPALLAASDSAAGLSVPLLLAAGAAALLWLATLAVAAVVRRPPRIAVRARPGTRACPPEPPAVAGLLCDDFVVGSEAAPATLLDLAARRVVVLEEVQPGNTICRLRDHDGSTLTRLRAHGRRPVAHAGRSTASSRPTRSRPAPTTFHEPWHREFAHHVVADAKHRGLTVDRWPARIVGPLGSGVLAVVALLDRGERRRRRHARRRERGRRDRDLRRGPVDPGRGGHPRPGSAARSRSCRPSRESRPRRRPGRCSGRCRNRVRRAEASPICRRRRSCCGTGVFAYAAAMGAARRAVTMLALGAEDDHRAWSSVGGRWRRVHVRYPRAWPPAWGKHPMLAILLALTWGFAGVAAIYWLARLASEDRDPSLGFSRASYDWVDRIAIVAIGVCALLVVWAVWVLVRAVPDLWARRTVTGEIVRDRRRTQVFVLGQRSQVLVLRRGRRRLVHESAGLAGPSRALAAVPPGRAGGRRDHPGPGLRAVDAGRGRRPGSGAAGACARRGAHGLIARGALSASGRPDASNAATVQLEPLATRGPLAATGTAFDVPPTTTSVVSPCHAQYGRRLRSSRTTRYWAAPLTGDQVSAGRTPRPCVGLESSATATPLIGRKTLGRARRGLQHTELPARRPPRASPSRCRARSPPRSHGGRARCATRVRAAPRRTTCAPVPIAAVR